MIVLTFEELMSETSELIAGRLGLNFPKERWTDLERGLSSAAKELGFKNAEAIAQWFLTNHINKNLIEILASHLTIGETYFLREKQSFQLLETNILPEIIQKRKETDKRLRIWSAGCCTGEEPYSAAILLHELIKDLKDWNITVLATDINPRFLRKAIDGVYNEWSFRDTPGWIKEKYFKKTKNNRYELHSSIKSMVKFFYLNLADDNYPSLLTNTNAIDIIFCRNVLMYFKPETAQKVTGKFYNSLLDGGWLLVSQSETSSVLYSNFCTVNFPNAIFYKKDKDNPLANGQSTPHLPFTMQELLTFPIEPEKISFEEKIAVNESVNQRTFLPAESENAEKIKTAGHERNIYSEAVQAFAEGRIADTVNIILKELSRSPNDSRYLILLARIYANEGRLLEALELCKKAVGIEKLNSAYHFLLATILHECGQVDGAILSLKKVIYLDHNNLLAHFTLGNLVWQNGRIKESQKHFRNALELAAAYHPEKILPEADGMTAGRIKEIIQSMLQKELYE